MTPHLRFLILLRSLILAAAIIFVPCVALAQSKLPQCPKSGDAYWHNCQGVYVYANKMKYTGEWQDNKKNGRGMYVYPDGTKYAGEFKDDEKHGQGTYTYNDGATYVGEYQNGEKSGKGTYTFKSGQKYVGDFKAGNFHGQGTTTYPNGTKYVGEFRDDKREGRGTYSFASGVTYVGEFKDGDFNGQGTMTYPNGEKYVGEFRNDKRNGQGTLYASSGSVKQAGIWGGDTLVRTTSETQTAAVTPPATPLPTTSIPSAKVPAGRRVALIIANGKYQNKPQLVNPVNDSKALSAALKLSGFDSVTVKNDLTLQQTVHALRDFASAADTADWAVIYYSGHGIEFNGVNYIVPIDARLQTDRDIDLEAVDIGKIQSSLEGAKKLRLVILDACRDNPFANQIRRTVATRSMGRGLAQIEPEAGTLVVFAAKHGQVALDGDGQNSPFVESLVKRIKTPNLEIRRLFDLVRDDVLASTARKQQPFSYGSLSGSEDFFFVNR